MFIYGQVISITMGTRYTVEGNVAKGQIVTPSPPKTASGLRQPRHTRGSHNYQRSKKLKAFQQCVGEAMAGKTGTREDIRAAFKSAVSGCKR